MRTFAKCVLCTVGVAAAAFGNHQAAMAAFDQAAAGHSWLQTAREDVGPVRAFWTWLKLPWRDTFGVVQLVGPKALVKLDGTSLAIAEEQEMRQAVRTYNDIAEGCDNVEARASIPACSSTAIARRFSTIDTNLERSTPGRDNFIRLANRRLEIAAKTEFSSSICNLYPSPAETATTVRFDPVDRLQPERHPATVAPGQCATTFTRKLRRAPTVEATASASPYRGEASEQPPLQWANQLQVSAETPGAVWGVRDPTLCHSSDTAICAGRRILNPLAYTQALATSRANDADHARLMPDGMTMFTMGIETANPTRRDEFGAIITHVAPGSPAELADFRVGDRIVGIADSIAFTTADLALAMDRYGMQHGRDAPLAIQVLRNGDILAAQIVLLFNQPYWDVRGYDQWWAFGRGIIRSATLGLDGHVYCARFVRGLRGEEAQSREECRLRYELEVDVARELYSFGFNVGAFTGGLVSPVNLLLSPVAAVPAALSSQITSQLVRQMLQGAAMSVVKNSIVTVVASRPNDTAEDIVRRIQMSTPQVALRGAVLAPVGGALRDGLRE